MSGDHGDGHGTTGHQPSEQQRRDREDRRNSSEHRHGEPLWGRDRHPSEHHRGREVETRAPGESLRDELRGLVNAARYQERRADRPADADGRPNPPSPVHGHAPTGHGEHGRSQPGPRHERPSHERPGHERPGPHTRRDTERPDSSPRQAGEHNADGKTERREKTERHHKTEPERPGDMAQKLEQIAVTTPARTAPDQQAAAGTVPSDQAAAMRPPAAADATAATRTATGDPAAFGRPATADAAAATRPAPDHLAAARQADAAAAARSADAAAAQATADRTPESRVSQLADTVYRAMVPEDGAAPGDRILAGLASGLVKTVGEVPAEAADMARLAYHAVADPTDFQPEREQWASNLAAAMARASTDGERFQQARDEALTGALVGATPLVGEVAMVSHLVSAIREGDDRKIGEALAPVAVAAAMHAARRGAGETGVAERPPRTMLEHAYHHGVRDEIPEGPIEVFAHGAPERFVNAAVETGGGNLSATGGNHGGQLHTLPSLEQVDPFATRAAGRGNDAPGVLGIALPESVARSMREQGQLVRGPVGNPPEGVSPGTQQWVFMPSGIERLKQEGFFFRIR
ncbi:hypothetical protein [Couchioplanes azureus]|uniref:hypothetical protein n=1 Tax=Couchioplanes caeruleus TaxID=56438 RepID=UPI00166FAB71|nr:hypothetical protein [Couchioplanes caeruleus]GGQ42785.1 hypothetical protein GCM10010166_08730 [Couchioplanes caeruleus subsp. azureus]